ncbi:fasciclin domain-containing protein [Pseudoroseicyclus aestuarii]|uniref:Putative surface protein with fasciclin (FAS1) repeats n=1 Tax=Pseudoroseicyclus aestuarii TaxID=1795041 RepID=A0A318T0I4_9RHOB|nr:fasciclin domain-containing protein [Pseudoroseicyclus aestuarii]PYE86236.1 putative surface protein with fasciclin (FAS1) repeats [Pseudoroseicyclus aestuarii]
MHVAAPLTALLSLSLLAAVPAQAQTAEAAPLDESNTVVVNAKDSPELSRLAAAIEIAGMAEGLEGPGPLTLFAPVDAGFEALPEGSWDSLNDPANRDSLVALIGGHVVEGALTTEALSALLAEEEDGVLALPSIAGTPLFVAQGESGLTVTTDPEGAAQATWIAADIASSNGVLHEIDAVLLPAQDAAAD